MATLNSFQPNYADTTAANLQKGIDSSGAIIHTLTPDAFWYRQSNPKQWIQFIGAGGEGVKKVDSVTFGHSNAVDTVKYWVDGTSYVAGLIDRSGGLVSGGIVSWNSGLKFDITSAIYYIGGIRYTSPSDSVTLATADATNPRIDVIGVDNTGHVFHITGTPATNPVTPQVDPATQLYLTSILVPAASTSPSGVSSKMIYDENVEWTGSASGLTANFANTSVVYTGTKSTSVGAASSGQYFRYDTAAVVTIIGYTVLNFHINLTVAMGSAGNINISFYNGTSLVGRSIPLISYGFSKSVTGVYQNVSVPMSTFALAGSNITGIKFQYSGTGGGGMYIDRISLQSGINNSGSSNNSGNDTAYVSIKQSIDSSYATFEHSNRALIPDTLEIDNISSGTVPDLQKVTDAGNTTTNYIAALQYNVKSPYVTPSPAQLATSTNSLNKAGGVLVLKDYYTDSLVTLNTVHLTNNRTISLPDSSGTLALSVNNNFADSKGNVTINSPTISTGTAAPLSTPTKVGDIYVDTTNKKLYFAAGTSSSADWIIAN